MRTKILIADDHPVTRTGVRAILERDESFEIIGEAIDGLDIINQTKTQKPDIIIMDISMPHLSGIEATKQILNEHPDLKIIALSIHSGEKFVAEMLDAGAVGYLLKEEAPEELLNALHKVIQGNIYLGPEVTRTALNVENTEKKSTVYKVLRTKLQRPLVLNEYIKRDRIIEQLEKNVEKPFSLVSAGAGYGKSVAVSQWLDHTKHLYSWVSLDEEQNDLRIFLTYIVEAIEEMFPGFLNETRSALSGTELPPLDSLSYIFLNELCDINENLILVLDDYHKISEHDIHKLLNSWIAFPPSNMHLTIITRRDPPLKTRPLLTMGRMTELRMENLSFTNEEIVEYFKTILSLDLSNKAIQTLCDKTEGWILALRLAAMVVKDEDDIELVLDNFEGSMNTISDYLVSEVVNKQTEDIRELMLISSISKRFSAELLDDIYSSETNLSGQQFIEWLQKSNMFIIDLDVEGNWFRYHHLFQVLLQEQFRKKDNTIDLNHYHLKASHWFEGQNLLEEAIEHALTIENLERAAEIVKAHRLDLLNSNNYFLLEHLQKKIPTSIIESDPELLLAELYIKWTHGNLVRVGELEELMNPLIESLDKDSNVRNEFYFFVGFNALILKGDLKSALHNFDIAMEVVPESAAEPRGVLELHYMIFAQLGGTYEKVRKMFYNLIDKDLAPLRKNRLFQGILCASINQADIEESELNYLNAISYSRETGMKDSLGIILDEAGSIMFKKGEWNNALKYFNEVLEIRYFVHSRTVIDSLTGLIIVHAINNEIGKAKEVIKLLESFTDSLGDFFKKFTLSAKTRYHMINQDNDTVKALLSDYKTGVLDVVLWLDLPEITHARALIFEGSKENLELAKEELNTLMQVTTALHNRIHLLEVYALQAICFDKLDESEKAFECLIHSIEIAEPGKQVGFYIELGEPIEKLISKMPAEFKEREFIKQIRNSILALKMNKSETSSIKSKKEIKKEKSAELNLLTSRELKVLECVALGLRNQEIAEKLFNSEETIKKHLYNMFQKLHVKNRMSLVTKAKEMNILE